MEILKGGFAFNATDEKTINEQRALTAQINNNFIQVGAIFLQMSGKNPFASDWHKRKFRDTNLQEWIDSPDCRPLNLGFNLQFGWLDVDIDSEDPRYNKCILAAFKYLGIDTRFAFGRMSCGVPSHIMVQLTEVDQQNYDAMKGFEPKEFKMGGKRYKSELRSMGPIDPNKPNAVKESRQTVMPGSIYSHKTATGQYDISVWYTSSGKVAEAIGEVAATTPRKTAFVDLLTGIAFGTFLYILQPHWLEGSRQNLAIKVAGWLARLVKESQGINSNEAVAQSTYCPIGTPEIAESMIEFICSELGDSEAHMRKRVFRDAVKKLDNNPEAKIPGWPVLEGSIGSESVMALRTVFMPGVDMSPLTKMAERYLYDENDDRYIDKERFYGMAKFQHSSEELGRRHSSDFIEVAGKNKPIFKVFEASPLRRRVGLADLYPDFEPGAVFRVSRAGEIVPDDEDSEPGTTVIFNTWRGWSILPAKDPDPVLLARCNSLMDQLFQYLTQNNSDQVTWLKKWIAWIIQNPGMKQQIAPVFVGGQGIGKSFFGNIFLGQLFQNQWGSASPKILEGAFSVEPFIGKMVVFIDEAKFHSEAATDEIKKLIRSDTIGGAEKFQSARTYRIFSRIVFASNRMDMNIGHKDVHDRALFYMKTYDKDFVKKTEQQFRAWAVTIKPFFTEFNLFLKRMDVREHFMYIFNTMPVEKDEVEDTAKSSGADPKIIESNMTWARRIAKAIIEEGRIWEDLDISAPFTPMELNKRVNDMSQWMHARFVTPKAVMEEFNNAGLVESVLLKGRNLYRFKYKIGTLTDLFSQSIGVELNPSFQFTEDDYGENKSELEGAKPWRGMNTRFRGGI